MTGETTGAGTGAGKRWLVTVLLMGGVAALLVLALVLDAGRTKEGERFSGSDAAAEELVLAAQPGYEPWFRPLFEPSGEVESGLFAAQAGIGGTILGAALATLYHRHRSALSPAAPGAVAAGASPPGH